MISVKLFVTILCFTIFLTSSLCNQCSSNGETCSEQNNSLYNKEANQILFQIAEALENYTPCSQQNCSCHLSVLNSDLKPFDKGITKDEFNAVAERGTKYQIIGKKIYRQKDCMFPARCLGIEHFLKKVAPSLPDMEMIINTRDWPQTSVNFGKQGPVFSFSKTTENLDIMYPTWAFWEGGPAISLYPTGIGRWDKHRDSITQAAVAKWPWDKKVDKAFFRGSRTSDERDSLVLLSREDESLVDAQYTKNQAWKSPKDTLNAEPANEVSFEDHCKFKFLFNFRGVAASFRLKHLFLCKSLVFHVGEDWQEFFYGSLKPWVHYVPVKSYPSIEELRSIVKFFKDHDDLAKEIADRGFQFVWDHLRMEDVDCYWKKLLRRYSKLIKYEVERDKNLVEIA